MTPRQVSSDDAAASEAAAGPGDAPRIAVLIPCYNEEAAIAQVVADFRAALPHAVIYVYDNNSTDRTAEVARRAGAVVRREPLQGKGNVIRRMFADVEADAYVLVDGDGTYHAPSAAEMVERLFANSLDMVNGARASEERAAYRPGHRFGNRLLSKIVRVVFGDRIRDMLSGYRVFSRRFVKSFPALSVGFETETELTIHALELRMPVAEITTPYGARTEGTASKLSTWKDGFRILRTILILIKEERPLPFFSGLFVTLAVASVALAFPVILTYLETGLVPRLPTAILATGIMILAFILLGVGLTLDTVTRGRRELKRLHYLSIPAPASAKRGGDGAQRS